MGRERERKREERRSYTYQYREESRKVGREITTINLTVEGMR